ncbi:MAG: F0F1 ATP synthase subunit A [Candidatus Nanopelagicales bacterium]|nr:F0F1 ATP synthase subunit A [Candidatus Nanopelagicales bacterium]
MLSTVVPLASSEGSGFHAPSVAEFFPGELLFVGTPFAMTRMNLIGLLMAGVLALFFVWAFAKPKLVPRGVQNVGELAIDVVYKNVIDEVMGEKGRKYAPYLISMFWLLFAFNITGIIPTLHIGVSSVIGIPLLFALIAWLVFNIQGIRALGFGHYLKANLFPPGIPWPIYFLVTPIELVSTFILRPLTLTIRLLANMMAGHLLLVLFFSATSALLVADGYLKIFALPAFAMGFAFTLFEILVAVLQAYIFTLLTAVYIDGATSEEH